MSIVESYILLNILSSINILSLLNCTLTDCSHLLMRNTIMALSPKTARTLAKKVKQVVKQQDGIKRYGQNYTECLCA